MFEQRVMFYIKSFKKQSVQRGGQAEDFNNVQIAEKKTNPSPAMFPLSGKQNGAKQQQIQPKKHPNSKRSSRCKDKGRDVEIRHKNIKQGEGRHTWAGEMSAPQGGRPVLSTANRRGKHLQDKQRAHYLWEQWQCRRQHTTLQLENTRNASFQNNKTSQCYLRKKWLLYFQLIREIFFLFLPVSVCFGRIFVKKTKGPRSLRLGMDHRYYGIKNQSDASFSTAVNNNRLNTRTQLWYDVQRWDEVTVVIVLISKSGQDCIDNHGKGSKITHW